MSDKKIIVTKSGEKYAVVSENAKFYICDKTAFRKASGEIAEIKTVKAKKAKEEREDEKAVGANAED